MLSIDTIKAKTSEIGSKAYKKAGDIIESIESSDAVKAIDNKIERDLLLTQRKWVDRTVFWGGNMVNNQRLNRMERIIGRTDGRVDDLNGDIEMARLGMEAELRVLQRQRERNADKNRPTDLIDEKIARRQQVNEKRIAKLESKREGLLTVRGNQEKSKDSFVRTRSSIANEMNDKLNRDIALIENQFNLKGLKYKEVVLGEELEKMDAEVAEIQNERDQILADAAELEQRGRSLRIALGPLDKELKTATRDRNRVFVELSQINARISSVEAKKAGWENLRTALGVTTEAVPKDRATEAGLMRARSREEQIKRLKDGDSLKNLIAGQTPDSYTINPTIIGDFFKDIRDKDGFNQLKPNDVRRGAEKALIDKRKAENEEKLTGFDENEKLGSLEKEKDSLWEYVFQKIAASNHIEYPTLMEELVAGPYADIRADIIDRQLKSILNNVGYAFDFKQYNANKDSFGRILLAKANERFKKLMEVKDKDEQESFFRDPDHKGYVDELIDTTIKGGNYIIFDENKINSILAQNGFEKINYNNIKDYLLARSIDLIRGLDLNGQLGILRKDIPLTALIYESGIPKTRNPNQFNYATFHAFLSRNGFDKISEDNLEMRNIITDYINRQ